jgi:putative cell wall-binding protein
MSLLQQRIESLDTFREKKYEEVRAEYLTKKSPHYRDDQWLQEQYDDITERFKEKQFNVIAQEIEKPIVTYLTVEQILERYGDILSAEEKQIIENL